MSIPLTEEQESLVDQFSQLTGSDSAESRHFLEAGRWDLEISAANFFEAQEDDVQLLQNQPSRPDVEFLEEHTGVSPVPIVEEPPESNDYYLSSSSGDEKEVEFVGQKKKVASDNTKMSGKKFATLFDGKQSGSGPKGESGSDSDEDESKGGQSFYVGGSEHSGQQVVGPPRLPNNPEDLVNKVFESARQQGAEAIDPAAASARTPTEPRIGTFGTGYTLGDTLHPSERIGPEPSSSARGQQSLRRTVPVTLRMWKNGFTVDDGELRDYNDPENDGFLQSIMKGQIPVELVREHRGAEIQMNMEQHKDQDYQPPATKPFSGEGRRLGGIVVPGFEPAVLQEQASGGTEEMAKPPEMELDHTKPVTQVQIRLPNGSKLIAKCNLDQKVRDLRQYICDTHPEMAFAPFVLMTTFPNRVIENEELSIADAGLRNAVVLVKATPQVNT